MTKLPLSLLGFRHFFTAFTVYCFPAATTTSHHGGQVPKTEGRGECHLNVECGNRSHESGQGTLEYHARQGRFRLRQRHPHNDQSEFPSGLP